MKNMSYPIILQFQITIDIFTLKTSAWSNSIDMFI